MHVAVMWHSFMSGCLTGQTSYCRWYATLHLVATSGLSEEAAELTCLVSMLLMLIK